MYLVFAPPFEQTEAELADGCFLTSGVGSSDTVWSVNDSSKLSGGRYFVGSPTAEERVRLISVDSATQVTVERGYEGSMPGSWSSGARMKKLSPVSGFASDAEWGATISNITITGNGSLKVGGGSTRIEESDSRCTYTGYWESYAYDTGWPSQWWAKGHARRCAPASAGDVRKVSLRYSYGQQHDLYLGTFLNTDCGKISVAVDGGALTTHDLFLSEYGGTTANILLRSGVAAGNHTVEITALYEKHASSTGYYFYFDYLWPLVPQDVPDPPSVYDDVSLAIDFDTDHGYKKPAAWHLWQLNRLGFEGHADVYMGVFWNNKRRRVSATYPYATVAFSGTPSPGDSVSISISGTTIAHAIGYGETLQQIVSHFRAAINGMFSGVWADDNFCTSTTLRIQSKAPSWTFTGLAVSDPNSVTLTLTDQMGTPGTEGDWEMIDSVSPVMAARNYVRKDGAVTITGLKTFQDGAEFGSGTKAANHTLEVQIKRALDAWTETLPAARWAKSIVGIGPVISAGLAAHIEIERCNTVGKIWRFAGLDPTVVWLPKTKRPWNAALKCLCWKIGESFVKCSGRDGDFYGKLYLQRKQLEQERNEAGKFADQAKRKLERFNIGKNTDAYAAYSAGKLPPAHIHSRAKRWAVKLFLAHYHHVAWKLATGQQPPKPYVISHLGHADFMAPPNFPKA